jgi:hypothetical protein
MDPALPPLPKTPEARTKTQGRKRKIESESESSSNISAFFPNQPAIHKTNFLILLSINELLSPSLLLFLFCTSS